MGRRTAVRLRRLRRRRRWVRTGAEGECGRARCGRRILAQEIAGYDLEKVIHATNPKPADYTPDAYADGMEQIVKQVDPNFVFLTHTYQVRDFAPKSRCLFRKVADQRLHPREGRWRQAWFHTKDFPLYA